MNKPSLSSLALGVSILAVLFAMSSGFGSGSGWWSFRTGFLILKISAYTGLAAAILSLTCLAVDRQCVKANCFFALLIGLVIAGIPWSWMRIAKKVPVIHDITTDTENPPAFSAILPLRKDAMNPAEYGGAEIAEKQKEAYPDIVPLRLNVPVEKAFSKALSSAKKMRWDIVSSDPKEGRIEATATTFWFRFKDDVVVRILPDKEGSRIDVRSVSRVGKGDAGTNARRIRRYLRLLAKV